MKPDQARIHTVLSDTISLLCRNGLNYERELKVQGVIGVTVDNSEVFIVHINEVFDCSGQEVTDTEIAEANQDDCTSENSPCTRIIDRASQRNVFSQSTTTISQAQRNYRASKTKIALTYQTPGYISDKPSSHENNSALDNASLPYAVPGPLEEGHRSVDKDRPNNATEHFDQRSNSNEHSKMSVPQNDDDSGSRDMDLKVVHVKDDDDDENVQNYDSITSSLQDSNDAEHSETEAEQHTNVSIHERRIKVESEESLLADSAAAASCNEFSGYGPNSSLPLFMPESYDARGFGLDLKAECADHRASISQHSIDGLDELSLPMRSKNFMRSTISPGQAAMAQRTNAGQPYSIVSPRKTAALTGYMSPGSSQTESQQNLWKIVARFVCEVPGCNTSFSNKQNLLRHQTHKHGRQKIPRQSRAAANFYAANLSASLAGNISLPNYMDSSEG